MDKDQVKKLQNILDDMENQSDLYKPTEFWIEASKAIIKDLNQFGLENFRSLKSSQSMFMPFYAFPEYMDDKHYFDELKSNLSSLTKNVKSNIKLEMLISGENQAFADYRVLVSSDKEYAPHTDKVSESNIGNPIEQFHFDERFFSRSFLNYLLGLNFLKQHIDKPEISTVMEIGGGFGTLGEILLGDERNKCFYINADIPPTSFVSSYYLKKNFGEKNIASYEDLKDQETLNIQKLKQQYKAINIASWQVPQLQGNIDLFVNFISFQEMEPDVVMNYCKYVTKLNPKYILLRNIKEGKKKKDENTLYGVKEPIIGQDYDSFLPNYKLLAQDDSIFGFKTEDNFHSQLRLYIREEN